jgi:tRNA(Ile)-lysidine synthase
VDPGEARVGLALSCSDHRFAFPLEVRQRGKDDAAYFQALILREEVGLIVVGLPVHMSGAESPQSRKAREYAAWLVGVTGLPALMFDERCTTAAAESALWEAGLTHGQRKERRDKVAAQMILQSYLESPARLSVAAPVEKAWRQLGDPAPGILVALSGGPDSVALLRALQSCCLGRVVPAHLNHLLRGEASDADEAFCASLGARCGRIDVAAISREEGGNIEAVARRERYRWLAEVAQSQGLRFVATGHTASDQAETVLHRLLRGTGLEGLRGIAPRRPLDEHAEVVRPLLSATRGAVLEYLKAIGQEFRTDATNEDLRLTRARIRHRLLPLLREEYNPKAEEALCRLAEQAEEWAAEEEAEAAALLARAESRPNLLSVSVLEASSRRLVRAALRLWWRREGWPMGEMGLDHWQGAAGVCQGEAPARDLPGGLRIVRSDGAVSVEPRQT